MSSKCLDKNKLMNKLFLFFGGIILGFVGCNKKDVSMLQDTINKADKVEVFVVDEFATPLDAQEDLNAFFMDYAVLNSRMLEKEEIKVFKELFADTSNFSYENLKMCPFIAKYGVSFSKKDDFVKVILTNKNCPKCLVHTSFDEEKLDLDLVNKEVYDKIEAAFLEE